jgi:hypothetical protein
MDDSIKGKIQRSIKEGIQDEYRKDGKIPAIRAGESRKYVLYEHFSAMFDEHTGVH